MLPPLNRVAAEISTALTDISQTPGARKKWIEKCWPYVQAMLELRSARDFYGIDSAEEVILGFLNVAGENWHGPQSDRLRAQLREHLYNAKEYHASNNGH